MFREVVLWEVDGYFVFMGDSGGLNKHYLGILGCLWWFLGVVAGIHGLLSNVWGYLGFYAWQRLSDGGRVLGA